QSAACKIHGAPCAGAALVKFPVGLPYALHKPLHVGQAGPLGFQFGVFSRRKPRGGDLLDLVRQKIFEASPLPLPFPEPLNLSEQPVPLFDQTAHLLAQAQNRHAAQGDEVDEEGGEEKERMGMMMSADVD